MADTTVNSGGVRSPDDVSLRAWGRRQSYMITPQQHLLRVAFAIFAWTSTLAIVPFCMYAIGPLWGYTLGLSAWVIGFTQTIHWFLVSVPEVTGLITINLLLRPTSVDPYANMHVYPPGLSFRFPWEQVKLGLYINLRIVTQPFSEDFSTKGSSRSEKDGDGKKQIVKRGKAGAGPKIIIRGSIQYRALLQILPRYIAVDESTINQGLVDIITSHLSVSIAKLLAERARTGIDTFQKELINLFQDSEQLIWTAYEVQMAQFEAGKIKEVNFEWLYAIDVLLIRIADAEFEVSYQQVLTSAERSERIGEIADGLVGRGIDPKDAMNGALIINGDVQKNVVEVEGNAGEALQGLLLGMGSLNLGGDSSRASRKPKQRGGNSS